MLKTNLGVFVVTTLGTGSTSEGSLPSPSAMKLWSWHEFDFSLIEGCVDPCKNEYWDDEKIRKAYIELSKRLRTNQIIWCYTLPGEL